MPQKDKKSKNDYWAQHPELVTRIPGGFKTIRQAMKDARKNLRKNKQQEQQKVAGV